MKVSRSTVAMWEAGANPPNDMLIQMADIFGCSIDYLLGRTDDRNSINDTSAGVETPALTDDALQTALIYQSLSPEARAMIRMFVDYEAKRQRVSASEPTPVEAPKATYDWDTLSERAASSAPDSKVSG